MDPDEIFKHMNLPHWRKENAIYHVVFRLHDSVPKKVRDMWEWERKDIIQTAKHMNRSLTKYEIKRLRELHDEKICTFLRNGYGSCYMNDSHVARIVCNAIKYFDNDRYKLFAWCIMPNHVHIAVQPFADHTLSNIVQAWKSFTAKESNKHLGRIGTFWMREYYDHIVRDTAELQRTIQYIWNNPDKANLQDWQWRWRITDKELENCLHENYPW